jgi:ATP-binding cassette subfamily F protein 3
VQSKIKALRKKGSLERISAKKNLEFEFISARVTGKCLIEAKDISFSFTDEAPLLRMFNLTVRRKDRIGVIGKNGKGKTTLLSLLAGELPPLSGKIHHHPHLRTAFFAQTNIQRLDPRKTVEEEILNSLPEYARNTARNICGTMMFEGDRALKKVRVLSGGEKSRVLLGKLLVSPANLLLLDEPTNHLDMESVDSLLEAIDAFEGAVIIVTHSEMILDAVATRLVVFDEERVHVFEGTYRDFLERSGWHDETPEPAGRQASEKKGTGRSRKDLKRIRAELINNRSRTLGPLQSEIDRAEEAITDLEQQVDQETEALVAASVKGDGESIRHLSMSIRNAKEKIDALFVRLEKLTEILDTKTSEFENKFNELKQAGRM